MGANRACDPSEESEVTATLLCFLLGARAVVAPVGQEGWSPVRVLGAIKNPGSLLLPETVEGITSWFGGEKSLANGSGARVEDLTVAWAISAPNAKTVDVVSDKPISGGKVEFSTTEGLAQRGGKPFVTHLVRIGKKGVYIGAAKLGEGQAFSWHYVVDGKPVGDSRTVEAYSMPPESKLMPGVKPGKLEQRPRMTSKVFGGTWHDWWVWTPAAFDPNKESNLVVFQDGQWAHNYAPVYFDNMVSKGDLEQTVVVFVTPGTFPDGKSDRSREYDTLGDAYSRFLLEELLPPVENEFKITKDPMRRCVAGLSSGGICSFTVAWNRPDKFGLVLSWIGSFTNIASGDSKREGGHNYPALIRKTDRKPIKVFLQDGANDLDNDHGNWPLGNREMEAALKFKKYETWAVWGNGFHSDAHGRACMPSALKWLFGKSKGFN